MKKLFTILTVALALVAVASCSNQEEFGNPAGEMVKVTYSLEGPAGVATKAMGEVTSDYQLYYEVRLWNGATLGDPLEGTKLSGNQTVTAAQWPVNIEFNLARNKQYKILFWAQSKTAPDGLYTINGAGGLTAVTIDYAKMEANNEDCDVFCGYDVITPAGSSAVSLTLSRPLALLSLGTSDAAEYRTASGSCEVGKVSATVTGTMGTGINVATGDITTGSVTIEVEEEPIDAYNAKTLAVGASSYNYLNAVYFIPGADLVSVEYTISDNQETPALITATPLQVTNVPVAANYRTNIVGKLLTGTIEYNITLDEFDGVKNKIDNPSFASIAALNAYFETLASNADNGNINPETVTLTAVEAEEPKTIVLPAVTENIKILMPVTAPDLELTMAYSDGANADQKPANIYFYVTNIKTLTADITSTHFELLSGSWITDYAEVHTSPTSFVVEAGARIGKVYISQGNAVIGGTVDEVWLNTGATKDGEALGEDNGLNVFLARTAAVQQVKMYAAGSGLVVEQPANNIEVDATDRKVCVEIYNSAQGSSATAQNGGQIYVKSIDANAGISATGADANNVASSVYIEEVKTGATVVTESEGDAEVNVNSDASAIEGTVVSMDGPQVVLMRYAVSIDSNFNIDVKRTYYNPETGLFEETNTPAAMTFKAAAAQAVADDYIVLQQNGIVNTVEIKTGVTVDFNGCRLEATKIRGVGDGKVIFRDSSFLVSSNSDSYYYSEYYNQFRSLVSFVASNFSTPYSEMDQETVAAIIGGGASYSGEIENVELRGGSYTFNPQQYTPNGIGLYKQFAEDFYMVALVPEANVLHQEIPANMISTTWMGYGDASFIPFESIPITDGYLFLSQDDYSSVLNSFYQDWLVDYVFSFDKDVASSTTGIWGAYGTMCLGIALPAFEAGQTSGMLAAVGWDWNYSSIVNTVTAFGCGTVNVSPDNEGTTISVELRIAPNDGNGRANLTTPGKYIMINHYDYTYMGPTGTGQNLDVEEEEEP